MAAAYSADQNERFTDRALRRAAGVRCVRMYVLGALGWHFFRFTLELPAGDYYVLALAVDPAERGSGIGSLLIEHEEQRAIARAARRLCLDVALDNDGARRLYERRGFVEQAISPRL